MHNEWTTVAKGVRRKIYPPGLSLMMMEVEFDKGAIGQKHRHIHEQLTYVLEGRFKFHLNEGIYYVEKGETICIPPNAEHGVEALEDGKILDTFTPLREDLLSNP